MNSVRLGNWLVVAATLGDYVTTVVGLSFGSMEEANPTAVAFMDALGVVGGFALLSIVGMVLCLGLAHGVRKQRWINPDVPFGTVVVTYSGIKLFATAWNANLIISVA